MVSRRSFLIEVVAFCETCKFKKKGHPVCSFYACMETCEEQCPKEALSPCLQHYCRRPDVNFVGYADELRGVAACNSHQFKSNKSCSNCEANPFGCLRCPDLKLTRAFTRQWDTHTQSQILGGAEFGLGPGSWRVRIKFLGTKQPRSSNFAEKLISKGLEF